MRLHLVDGTYELYRAHFSPRPGHRDPSGADGNDASRSQFAPYETLVSALCDDLNTPAAIAHLHALHGEVRARSEAAAELRADAEFLGLDVRSLAARHGFGAPPERIAEIERIVAERDEARQRRDWAASDKLRDELAELGVAVKDGKAGATWEFRR